jgi:hypothetical protein
MPDTVTVEVAGQALLLPSNYAELQLKWANGNPDAAAVISTIGQSCQIADDLVDKPDHPDKSGGMLDLVTLTMGALQTNAFYDKHRLMLQPIVVSSLLYWDLANTLVKSTLPNDLKYAYAYREIIEQVVGIVALLTGGIAHARRSLLEAHAYHHVLNIETFEQFEAEVVAAKVAR